jgi:hypothetical protein
MSVGVSVTVGVGVASRVAVGLAEGETDVSEGGELVGSIWSDPPSLLRMSEVVIHKTMIVITRTKTMTRAIKPRITLRSSVDLE